MGRVERGGALNPRTPRAAGLAALGARAPRALHTPFMVLLISDTQFSLYCPPTENKRPFLKSPEM